MNTMKPTSSSINGRADASYSADVNRHKNATTTDPYAGNWLAEHVTDWPMDTDLLPPQGYELAIVGRSYVVRAVKPVHKKLTALVKSNIIGEGAMNKIFSGLVSSLWQIVFGVVSYSVVVELAAAKSTGLLQGDNEVERYQFFVEFLADPDFTQSFLESSPTIAAQLEIISKNWRSANLELLTHLFRDHKTIRRRFFPNQTSTSIVAISPSEGDTHRGGRSVAVFTFDDGTRLVYKPRSLSTDLNFSNFVHWFNTIAGEQLLASVSTLDCGDHGWCEFIEHRPVGDKSKLDAYYFRLGILLATARTLGLSDLHSENLIAAGNWPIIIDLETLFHPSGLAYDSSGATSPATDRLHDILDRSVFASGLLPVPPDDLKSNADWLDMSGTSDIAGQRTPFGMPGWQNTGTDEMCLRYEPQTMDGNQNIPTLDGKRVLPKPFVAQIISGYRKAYNLLESERSRLLSKEGPLMAFADSAVRIVLRPTLYYEALLFDGFHPTIMQSPDHKAEWQKKALDDKSRNSPVRDLVGSEQVALWQNDVPYFETTPGSTNVRSCDGKVKLDFLSNSGLSIARQTIEEMGEDDLARQCWLIKVALARAEPVGEQELAMPNVHRNAKLPISAISECAPKIAHAAAQYLCDTAVSNAEHANWLTLQESVPGMLSCRPAGLDLYSGLPGIALFLSHAGLLFENNQYTDLARAAVREMLHLMDEKEKPPQGVGGYSGVSGLAYALFKLQRHFPDLQLARASLEQFHSIDMKTLEISSLEMIDGLAGLISCLCAICENDLNSTISEKENRFFINLIRRSCKVAGRKLEIPVTSPDADPILSRTGMAHGTVGLKYALARTQRLGVGEISGLADKALGHLSRSEAEKSKTDTVSESTRPVAWCNGLTGLILGKASANQLADKRLLSVLNDRLEQGQYSDDSLCHGSMGAVAALNYLKSTCSTALVAKVNQSMATVLERIQEKGIRCGTINEIQSPGLMDGMSGVGMAALSLVQPEKTPMVLCLK